MNKKYSLEIRLFVVLALLCTLLGLVPASHAQSVQTWSEPINLSLSGAATKPSMVVDSKGVLHVIWVDEFDGHKYTESTDGGITWTSPKNVRFPFSTKVSPIMFQDAKGLIYIFWLSERNELTYSRTVAENLDVPASWQSTSRLDAPVFDFDIAIDARGNLHLAYVKNPAPEPGVAGAFYRGMPAGTASWSAPTQLYESTYFRSLAADNARIRIAASDSPEDKSVYVVWDERSQKRIFLARSVDGGLTWEPAHEVVSPQASLGFKTPFQSDASVLNNKLQMTWQVGDPGARCTPYSWTSSDGGVTWDEPVAILTESAQCPESSEFIQFDPKYSVELFSMQGRLSISAWNGTQWSNPEIQTGPSSITDPATFDTVLLGCAQTTVFQDHLYVVGCDQNADGDIWFIARQLDPLETLFPKPSAWGGDTTVTSVQQTITSLTSITDNAGNIHAVWIQALGTLTDPVEPRIEYARGNGGKWMQPAPIFTDLNGTPLNLDLQIDNQHRLLLAWVNQSTGDLLFSWANSERANLPMEWIQPVIVSPSPLTNSPDIVVDAVDRIVIAYSIPLNEKRGIYVIQSTDLGVTWSEPMLVFDGIAANWDMVDEPKLAVTPDGKMHLLFTRYNLLGGQVPAGLYYSQSPDGGSTWTTPDIVSEQNVQWSELVATKDGLHRFWQEKNKNDISTYHQLSLDGGNIWNTPAKLPIDEDVISAPALSVDGTQTVHLIQLVEHDVRSIQEWVWSADRWSLTESRKVAIPEQESQVQIAGGIASNGTLYSLLQFDTQQDEISQHNLLSINRSLDANQAPQPFLATIPTPLLASLPDLTPDVEITPTPTSPLATLEVERSPIDRNMVGLSLIVVVVLVIVVITVPRRGAKTDSSKRTK